MVREQKFYRHANETYLNLNLKEWRCWLTERESGRCDGKWTGVNETALLHNVSSVPFPSVCLSLLSPKLYLRRRVLDGEGLEPL